MASPTQPRREQWTSQYGFLMAAIGSAIGLGNIWRFPGVAYTNGGGAFMIPYLISLLAVGVPILFLDYALGHRYRGSAPTVFRRLLKNLEVVGWFQVAVCFVIITYYAVVIAWAVAYAVFSVKLAWGDDPGTFFMSFLGVPDTVHLDMTPSVSVLIPLVGVWVFCLIVIALGVTRGVENLGKIFMPILIVVFTALVIRALFLPGAIDGLTAFFTPNWSQLTEPSVWIAAFAQTFYSISVGFGIMLTYASYLGRRANLGGSGLVAAFANSSFEVLAGIGVFSVLGFMATQQGVPVAELKGIAGPSLSFVTFPAVISMMPGGPLFGVLFFISIVIAGMTSLVSLVQVVSAGIEEKLGLSARTTSLAIGFPAAIVSIVLFSSRSGLFLLDIVDKYINEIGVVTSALLTIIVVLFTRKMSELRMHLNTVSSNSIGAVWTILVGGVVPAALLYMGISTIISLVTEGYGGYESAFTTTWGWGTMLFTVVFSVVWTFIPWKQSVDDFTPIPLPKHAPARLSA